MGLHSELNAAEKYLLALVVNIPIMVSLSLKFIEFQVFHYGEVYLSMVVVCLCCSCDRPSKLSAIGKGWIFCFI